MSRNNKSESKPWAACVRCCPLALQYVPAPGINSMLRCCLRKPKVDSSAVAELLKLPHTRDMSADHVKGLIKQAAQVDTAAACSFFK